MRLFELNESKEVQLNKPWILLIPELKKLLSRDKGGVVKGDYDGRHKLRAIKDFTFIYFYSDFNSPIRDWPADQRIGEAAYYAGLDPAEVAKDTELWDALKKYEQLLLESSLSLRSYRAMLKAKDALDDYFENLDFTQKDKMGKLLNDPNTITASGDKMGKFLLMIKTLGKAVEEELKDGGNKIRGTAEKGENEDKVRKWSEEGISKGSERLIPTSGAKPTMGALSKMLKSSSLFDEEDDEDESEDYDNKD